jgi:hypothetical protein
MDDPERGINEWKKRKGLLGLDGQRSGLPDDDEVATVEWLFGFEQASKSPDGLPVFMIDNRSRLDCRVDSEHWWLHRDRGVFHIDNPKTKGRFRVLCQLLGIDLEEYLP